jgi:Zn ribbon nucleic-acid-binding protein
MTWTIDKVVSEDAWFQDYVKLALTTVPPKPPAAVRHIGSTTTTWFEIEPGRALMYVEGGTVDDRALARNIVKAELEVVGIRPAEFTFDREHKTADWQDIETKAARLIDSGNVRLLRNGYETIVGHVVGDHGEYQTEISREDPNSRAITQWTCECPWDQYAFQRTRKWKHLEARPCAHVLATYWAAQSAPLDEDAAPIDQGMLFDPGTAQPTGPGQMAPTMPRGLKPQRPGVPRPRPALQPGQLSIPGVVPGMAETTEPFASGLPPTPQPDVLPQWQDPSLPAPVSVPGARPRTPGNPVQNDGGTFSKVANEWDFSDASESMTGWKYVFDTNSNQGLVEPMSGSYLKGDHMVNHFDLRERAYSELDGFDETHNGTVREDGLIYPFAFVGEQYPANLLPWIQQTVPHARFPADAQEEQQGKDFSLRVAAWDDYDNALDAFRGQQLRVVNNYNWQPGMKGKWLLLPDQPEIHVWPTGQGGKPGHFAYCSQNGLSPDDVWMGETGDTLAGGTLAADHQDTSPEESGLPTHTPQGFPIPTADAFPDYPPVPESQEIQDWLRDTVECPQCGQHVNWHLDAQNGLEHRKCPTCGWERSEPAPGGKMDHLEQLYRNSSNEWDFSDTEHEAGYKFVYHTGDGRGSIVPAYDEDGEKSYHWDIQAEAGYGHLGANDVHAGTVAPDGLIWVYNWPGKPANGSNLEELGVDRHPPRLLSWIRETMPNAYYPQNEQELAIGDSFGQFVAAKGDEFQNSDMVRIEDDELGIAEGKSEGHGAGEYRNIPKNSIGEVLGQDPTTGWVDCIFPLHDSGPMEPFHVRAWIDPSKLTPMPNIKRPGPFIKRRTNVGGDHEQHQLGGSTGRTTDWHFDRAGIDR